MALKTLISFNLNGYSLSFWVCLNLLLLLSLSSGIVDSHNFVTSLPGFVGDLPFKLETGYVGVDEEEDVQLFYYFVQSQRTPAQDPLVLWLTGGPGCSGLSAFFYESGPLNINYRDFNGSFPTIHLNEYAWTQGLNMIYIDQPVGTGFSYSKSLQGYYSSDRRTVLQLYEFLSKWLFDHPEFMSNNLYIGGDSYSGVPVPMLVQEISNGNKAGHRPLMNIKGYVLGNPKTDTFIDDNSRIPFAYGLNLINKELYESAAASCNGDYVYVDPSNVQCLSDLDAIEELLRQINLLQVLEPTCSTVSLEASDTESNRRFLRQKSESFISSQLKSSAYWCRDYNYVPLGIWANEKVVQEALQIRNGTKEFWVNCNSSIEYTQELSSVVDYHRNLTSTGVRALIYSGDHDLSVPTRGTQDWIRSLNITLSDSWRAWSLNGQTAGYVKKYTNDDYSLTYATVKGAGHIAPEYKPEQCYTIIDRWFAFFPL